MDTESESSAPIYNIESVYEVDQTPWSTWTRRLVSIIILITVIIGLLLAGEIYGQVVLALVLCMFLFLPIRLLMRVTGLSYGFSAALTFIAYLITVILLVLLFTIPLINFVTSFVDGVNTVAINLLDYLHEYTPGSAVVRDVDGNVTMDLNFIFDPLSEAVNNTGGANQSELASGIADFFATGFNVAFGIGGSIAYFVYSAFFVHLLAVMFLFELPHFYRWLIRSLSDGHKRQYGVLLARFYSAWTAYLWSTVIISAVGAVVTWLLMIMLGVPDALGITGITTLVLLIPFFGPVIGTVICFFAAFIGGVTVLGQPPLISALITAILFFLLRGIVVGNMVYPRIVGKSLNVPSVIVLIALSFFGSLGGILGMFFSPVIAAFLRDMVIFINAKMHNREPFSEEATPQFMWINYLESPANPGI